MTQHYWELLELTPTHDKKKLRQAYSKKIKQFKPEKFPEEFKQIRTAYEMLLNQIDSEDNESHRSTRESLAERIATKVTNQQICDKQQLEHAEENLIQDLKVEPNNDYDESEKSLSKLSQVKPFLSPLLVGNNVQSITVESIVEQLTALTMDKNIEHTTEPWQKVLDQVEQLDLFSRQKLSSQAFYLLLRYVQRFSKRRGRKEYITYPFKVMKCFDETFLWSKNNALTELYDESDIKQVIPRYFIIQQEQIQTRGAESQQSYLQQVDSMDRFIIMLVDFCICCIPAIFVVPYLTLSSSLITKLHAKVESMQSTSNIGLFQPVKQQVLNKVSDGLFAFSEFKALPLFMVSLFICYLLYVTILELSPLRRTIGAKICKTTIGTRQFKPARFTHRLCRLTLNSFLLVMFVLLCWGLMSSSAMMLIVAIALGRLLRQILESYSPVILYRVVK